MYKIEKKEYGLYVVMGGLLTVLEVKRYVEEKEAILSKFDGPYSMMVDIRTVVAPHDEMFHFLKKSQEKMKSDNLQRMSIIVDSPVVYGIAKQLGFESGIHSCTRVINSLNIANWEEISLDWVIRGIEPDLNKATSVDRQSPAKHIL